MEGNLLSETSPLNAPIDDILPGSSTDNQFEGISEPKDEDEVFSYMYQTPRNREQRRTKQTEATGKEKQKQTAYTHWRKKSKEIVNNRDVEKYTSVH